MSKTKEAIEKALRELVVMLAPKKTRKGGTEEKALYQIFAWQTISKMADEKVKSSWDIVQPSLIPDDDALRRLGRGEHIITEAGPFSAVATIQAPRTAFDVEMFTAAVAKKYRIDIDELNAMAENCRPDQKAPLSKRVLEA